MKGYCISCNGLVDETEQVDGYCYSCNYNSMRSAYINAGNILQEVHLKQEVIQSEQIVIKKMLDDIKIIFQKGWGVPK